MNTSGHKSVHVGLGPLSARKILRSHFSGADVGVPKVGVSKEPLLLSDGLDILRLYGHGCALPGRLGGLDPPVWPVVTEDGAGQCRRLAKQPQMQ